MPVRPPQSPATPWAFFKNVRLAGTEMPVVKVLIGAHSTLSDGQSTPEELIAAARQAGYGAIFFTEPMPAMTREKYARLQQASAMAPAPISPPSPASSGRTREG